MYHRIRYDFPHPIITLSVEGSLFLERRYFILDSFKPVAGHLMLEKYDSKTIWLLVAFPSYLDPITKITQRVRRYLDALMILDYDDFDGNCLHDEILDQARFFDALVLASLNYSHETEIGVFYKTYHFEKPYSMDFKVISLPRKDNAHIEKLVKEEGNQLASIENSLIQDHRNRIILLNEMNAQKAETWYQWLAMSRNQSDGFHPQAQWSTRIRSDMPLGDLIHLCPEGFHHHLLGNQWIIELSPDLIMVERFAENMRRLMVPQLLKVVDVGQVIIRVPNSVDIQSWFPADRVLAIRDECFFSEFEDEPEWAL